METVLGPIREWVAQWEKCLKLRRMYSPSHTTYLDAIETLTHFLEQIHTEIQNLEFLCEVDRLTWEGHTVYQRALDDENLAYILYRDGVRQLVFMAGWTLEESLDFFDILHAGRMRTAYDEDDIVTLFWIHPCPHFRYHAVSPLATDAHAIALEDEQHNVTQAILTLIREVPTNDNPVLASSFPVEPDILSSWKRHNKLSETDYLILETEISAIDTVDEIQTLVLDLVEALHIYPDLEKDIQNLLQGITDRALDKGDLDTLVFLGQQLQRRNNTKMMHNLLASIRFQRVQRLVVHAGSSSARAEKLWPLLVSLFPSTIWKSGWSDIENWPPSYKEPLKGHLAEIWSQDLDSLYELVSLPFHVTREILLKASCKMKAEERRQIWIYCINHGDDDLRRECIVLWAHQDPVGVRDGLRHLWKYPDRRIWLPLLGMVTSIRSALIDALPQFRPDLMDRWDESLIHRLLSEIRDPLSNAWQERSREWITRWGAMLRDHPALQPIIDQYLSPNEDSYAPKAEFDA